MNGIFYGVGVGPGDPELMTLKAVRLIKENTYIACPGKIAEETVAYKIAEGAVPELSSKQLISIYMPMTKDRDEQKKWHRAGAEQIMNYLSQGQNVVFLTLGDPSVYSTFYYLQKIILDSGYESKVICGIPSFCAAAARTNTPLTIWNDTLHIYPAVHAGKDETPEKGTCVMMKAGSQLGYIKEMLIEQDREGILIENCGMPDEHIYRSPEEFPEKTGYYSLIISRDKSKLD